MLARASLRGPLEIWSAIRPTEAYHRDVIALDAYAADCRVHGNVEIGDARMTDTLNSTPSLTITDARLESLSNGHVVDVPELTVGHEELCAVVANGSRGELERRLRTRTTRVEVDLGPYHVVGAVHGTPASDPLVAAFRRGSWVPLTDTTVTYRADGQEMSEEVSTLVVNRDLATLFRAIEEEVGAMLPWESTRMVPARVRALDMSAAEAGDVGDRPAAEPATAAEPLV